MTGLKDIPPAEGLLSLHALETRIVDLAGRIDAPPADLPEFGPSPQDGRAHLEVDKAYHYVVSERGREQQRYTTSDLDDLLYRVFAAATFSMACDFEARHRRPDEDFRRQLFAEQLRLLEQMSPHWRARRDGELKRVLERSPFRD